MLHLQQGLSLQQKLSPAQVQFLKLLQLPLLSLEQKIRDELDINPLLEEGEMLDDVETPAQTAEDFPSDETAEENGPDAPSRETAASDGEDDFIEREIREHRNEEYSWEEFLENNEGANSKNWYDNTDEDYEYPAPAQVSMEESLIEQLNMLDVSEEQKRLGAEIIGSLDDDGYLRRDLLEIVAVVNHTHGLALTEHDAQEILHRIQRLDPPGIAARDLRECLIVQLELMPNTSTARIIALRILRECFEALSRKHFDRIMKDLQIDEDMLRRAFAVITKLDPKPGEGNINASLNYVIPDFFLYRDRDDFIITLNERGVPPIRVNQTYRQMMADKTIGTDTRKFLRQKHAEAVWFIDSIEQRRRTLLSVMQAIVVRQREFMEKGPGHLKPLIYKDIAEMIGMDISTISRVANGKYVQTEWGVFQLKFFFSEGIPTADGEEVSNKEVKSIIRTIISGENPRKPLSDEAIMNILHDRGFDIARRTVAKYRESLGIPVSRLRNKLV